MIAKPSMPEAEIRAAIDGINADLRSGKMERAATMKFWLKERRKLLEKLDDWQTWRKQDRVLRARHQRPSVRRHITRRVRTPL